MAELLAQTGFETLLPPPPGWRTTDALLLTYSLDPFCLNELLRQSGLADTYCASDRPAAMEAGLQALGRHVFCAFQAGRAAGAGKLLPAALPYAGAVFLAGRVRAIPRGSGVFHPKLWAFRYEQGEKIRLRLVLSSRNLTREDNLECALCLEGTPGERAAEANRPLVDLLQFLGVEEEDPVLQAVPYTDFTPCVREMLGEGATIRFLTPQSGLSRALEEAGTRCRRAVYVSPFCGDLPWKVPRGEFRLVTLPESFTPAMQKENLSVWYLADREEEPDPLFARPLHGKLYAFDREEESRLFIGSANSSANGFLRNRELMAELAFPGPGGGLVPRLWEALGPLGRCLTLPEPVPQDREDRDFPSVTPDGALWRAMARAALKLQREGGLLAFFADVFQARPAWGEGPADFAIRCLLAGREGLEAPRQQIMRLSPPALEGEALALYQELFLALTGEEAEKNG